VHNDFWHKAEEYMVEQAKSKSEACPVMSIFHNLQAVPIEIDFSIKIHGIESLHWNLVFPAILSLIGRIFEGKIVFDWATGVSGLFVLARSEHRCESPVCKEDWN